MGGLYVGQKMKACYEITLIEQLSMKLRKLPVDKIKQCLKRCKDHSIAMNVDYLQSHSIAGGDIEDLVDGLIYCRRNKLKATHDQLAARQIYEQFEGKGDLVASLRVFIEAGIYDLSKQPFSLE